MRFGAKENFIGGNMIPTNGAGSGIHVDEEHFTEFPKPTANVKLLDLDLEDKEKTFFLGDQITVADLYEKLLKTLTMEENQIIPNLVLKIQAGRMVKTRTESKLFR